jgi:hypothetical protein
MNNFVKLQLSQPNKFNLCVMLKCGLVHLHTQFYYKITNVTYMLVQNRGHQHITIIILSHKCNCMWCKTMFGSTTYSKI